MNACAISISLTILCILLPQSPILAQTAPNAVPQTFSPVLVDEKNSSNKTSPYEFTPNQDVDTVVQKILRKDRSNHRFKIQVQPQNPLDSDSQHPDQYTKPVRANDPVRKLPQNPSHKPNTHFPEPRNNPNNQQPTASSYADLQTIGRESQPSPLISDHIIRNVQKFLPDQYLQELISHPNALREKLDSIPATDLTDHTALLARGLMNITGLGGPRDISRGFGLIKQTATQGDPYAIDLLGDLHLHGIGTPPNAILALQEYKRINPAPIHVAEKIADLYRSGIGTERNLTIAMTYYEAAYDGGSTSAGVKLADLYRDGDISSDDVLRAFQLYEHASIQGDILGTVRLADMHRVGESPNASIETALQTYLSVANTQGIVDQYSLLARNEARTKAGELLMAGEGVDRDPSSALRLWRQAGKEGYALATRNIGLALQDGNGIQQNTYEAIRVLRISEYQGSIEARQDADSLVVNLCGERGFAFCLPTPIFYATTRGVSQDRDNVLSFGVEPDSSGKIHFGISWWPIPNDRTREKLNWLNVRGIGPKYRYLAEHTKGMVLGYFRNSRKFAIGRERVSSDNI